MAEQPKYFEIEDYDTGKRYRVEAYADDVTYDEAVQHLSSLPEEEWSAYEYAAPEATQAPVVPETTPAVVAPVKAPVVAGPRAPVLPEGVTPEVGDYQLKVDSLADPSYQSKELTNLQKREYLSLLNNPRAQLSDVNNYLNSIGRNIDETMWQSIQEQRKNGLPFGAAEAAYAKEIREELIPDWALSMPELFQAGPEGNGWDSMFVRSAVEESQYGSSGVISRLLNDWMDTGGDIIDQRFPDLSSEERENLQEAYVTYLQRTVRDANEKGVANDHIIPWLAAKIVSPDLADLVGLKVAKFASTGARVAGKGLELGGVSAIADIGYQAADISAGVQEGFDLQQTAISGLTGTALGAGGQGLAEGVGRIRTAGPETPPTPATASTAPIVVPTNRKGSKAYAKQLDDVQGQIVGQVNTLASGWTNAPRIEVHPNFEAVEGVSNKAIGVYTTDKDGKPVVQINTEAVLARAKRKKVSPESVVESVTFHEALGHHGLTEKFGEQLDTILDIFYTNGDKDFRKIVDKWIKDNPKTYEGPTQRVRATEEVLAEWSEENGVLPKTFLDMLTNKIKNFARDMGRTNLKFTEREIKAYLGVAQRRVIEGTPTGAAPDVVKNVYGNHDDIENTTSAGFKRPKIDSRFIAEDRKLRRQNAERNDPFAEPTNKYMRDRDNNLVDSADEDSVRRAEEILRGIKDNYQGTTRSFDEAKRDARLNGLRSRQYKSEKSLDDLDVRLFQYDTVNDRYQEKLLRLAERRDNAKDANEYVTASAEYKKTFFEYKLLSSKIQNDQAQIARALNAMKALNLTKRKVDETLGLIDEVFGNKTDAESFAALDDPETFDALVKMMTGHIQAGNKAAAAKVADKVLKPYWWQYVLSYLHNSMLSGLGTQAVNAYDAVNVLGRKLEERTVAGVIGTTRKALGAKDTMSALESVGFTVGVLRALVDADTYKNTYKAFKEGYEFQPFGARIERQDVRIPYLSVVNDLLYASDMFWRSFHMSANLYSLGIRQAHKDGFRGMELMEEGYANAVNADKALYDEAKLHADEALLVDTPSAITSWIETGKQIKPNMTAGQQTRAFTLNLLFPFLRVSDRLVFQALKRVPVVAFLDHNTRREWAMGGAAMDSVLARQLMGGALMYYYWEMADPENADQEGYIEGFGEENYQKTQALEATGYRSQTVTEEDGVMRNANQINITANPFNTRNNIAVAVATARQNYERSKKTEEDANQLAISLTAIMRASGKFLLEQGYADNITPYVAALETSPQQEANAANAVGEAGSRAVPALVRQFNQMYFDPIKRDTTGDKSFKDRVTGRIGSGIPGLSSLMPANLTALGEEQEQGRTLLRLGDGTPIKKGNPYEELRKLEREIPEPILTEFKGSFKYGGETLKLNSFEKNKWQGVQGQYIRDVMMEWVASPDWKKMSTEDKAGVVKDIRKEGYEYAKEQLLDELLDSRGYGEAE